MNTYEDTQNSRYSRNFVAGTLFCFYGICQLLKLSSLDQKDCNIFKTFANVNFHPDLQHLFTKLQLSEQSTWKLCFRSQWLFQNRKEIPTIRARLFERRLTANLRLTQFNPQLNSNHTLVNRGFEQPGSAFYKISTILLLTRLVHSNVSHKISDIFTLQDWDVDMTCREMGLN